MSAAATRTPQTLGVREEAVEAEQCRRGEREVGEHGHGDGDDGAEADGDEHGNRKEQASAEANEQCRAGNQHGVASEHHHALHA